MEVTEAAEVAETAEVAEEPLKFKGLFCLVAVEESAAPVVLEAAADMGEALVAAR